LDVILDTNGLSAIADGNPLVLAVVALETRIAVPAIVLGEYLYGIRKSRYRMRYEQWLAEALVHFSVLRVEELTAGVYAEVREEMQQAGRPIPVNDLWIAALVRQHGQPLLSRDQHFDFVPGLERVAW
jgi:tRNA(fMet)-specific endonuclease VapC